MKKIPQQNEQNLLAKNAISKSKQCGMRRSTFFNTQKTKYLIFFILAAITNVL